MDGTAHAHQDSSPTHGASRWLSRLVMVPLVLSGPVAAPAALDESVKVREQFSYDPKGRRDPFSPLVQDGRILGVRGVAIETSKPTLHGILWDPGGNSIALINDVEVKVGEEVAGFTVEEIRRDAVVLSHGDQRMTLEIKFD